MKANHEACKEKTSKTSFTLREKSPNSEFFVSIFSHICTEYRDLQSRNTGKYGPEKLRTRAVRNFLPKLLSRCLTVFSLS